MKDVNFGNRFIKKPFQYELIYHRGFATGSFGSASEKKTFLG